MQICKKCGGVKRGVQVRGVVKPPGSRGQAKLSASERRAVANGWDLGTYRWAMQQIEKDRAAAGSRSRNVYFNPPDPYKIALAKQVGERPAVERYSRAEPYRNPPDPYAIALARKKEVAS